MIGYHLARALTAGVALAAATIQTPARAADIAAPVYKARPAAAYSWTGFYVGGTAGAAWTAADVDLGVVNGNPPLYDAAHIPGLQVLGSPRMSESHAIFGGKLGYNWQQQTFVYGLEADISSFRFNRSASTAGNPFPPSPSNGTAFDTNVSTDWLATFRARGGYAFGQTFFYATGGAAIANVKFSNAYRGHSPSGAGEEFGAASASETRLGWAAGAGIDYAFAPNWIVSLEYLHVDLGSIDASGLITTGNANTATFNFSTRLTSDVVRGGISYKF